MLVIRVYRSMRCRATCIQIGVEIFRDDIHFERAIYYVFFCHITTVGAYCFSTSPTSPPPCTTAAHFEKRTKTMVDGKHKKLF